MVCDCLTGSLKCVGGHICLTRHLILLVLLHLQSLDTVRKLDKLDATLETSLGDVCTNFRQQVVVAGSLAGKPNVLKRSLSWSA